MNKATKIQRKAEATLTTMVRDGIVYEHDPATVGHATHTAACWTVLYSPEAPTPTTEA